jgi:hypothetical protein
MSEKVFNAAYQSPFKLFSLSVDNKRKEKKETFPFFYCANLMRFIKFFCFYIVSQTGGGEGGSMICSYVRDWCELWRFFWGWKSSEIC